MCKRLIVLSSVALWSLSALLAQTDRATITGTVKDQSGAVVPGAAVKAVQVSTNLERSTNTTSQGDYTIPQLPVGTYRVEISGQGFRTLIRSDVVLTAGGTVRVDGSLTVGQLSESVEVSAQAPMLQTDTAKISTGVSTRFVEDLPLVVGGALRSPIDLALIAPETKDTTRLSLGGGQDAGWELTVDGLSGTSSSTINHRVWAQLSSPSVEAITEFSMDSNGFKADFGNAGGGVISFVTKSGSNKFHGTAYEFLRNNALDANAWFNNALNAKRPVLRQSDFGFNLGGPLWIPKLYNGRDKTFFFVNYEGFRNRTGTVASYQTIPLPEMYNGDFSNWKNNTGVLIPIYDPSTTRSDGKGGWTRDVFSGNSIPVAKFSTISKNVIKLATMSPNRLDPAGILNPNPRNNFVDFGGGSVNPYDKFSVKADHMLSSKDRLGFLFNWGTLDVLPMGRPAGLPVPLNDFSPDHVDTHVYRATWDRTITPRILNHLAYGYNNTYRFYAQLTANQGWGTKLGLKNTPNPNLTFPGITMDDYSRWNWANYGGATSPTWMGADDLNVISGSHSLKFGFTYRQDHYNGFGQHTAAGSYNFSRLTTSFPLDQTGRTGNGFASLLLGQVNSSSIQTPRNVSDQWKYYAAYAQDDWRATSKLTINYGLRYEYTPPTVEGHFPDGYSNFDPTLPNPGADGRLGAMIFAGKGAGRTGKRTMYPAWRWGFSPRLGMAYSLDSRTVIRASASRTFGFAKNTGGSSHWYGFLGEFSWASQDSSITQPFNWDNGVPSWPQPPFLVPDFLNRNGVTSNTVYYWQPHDAGRLPEYLNWSFNMQRQLPANMLVDIGYNATMGHHLATNMVNLDQMDPQVFYQYVNNLGFDGAYNLMSANIASSAARAASVPYPYPSFTGSVGQALRPYPQYGSVNTSVDGGDRSGNSSYHAMIVKFEKRYSSGLTFLTSYVLSKMFSTADGADASGGGSMDGYNLVLEKALASSDQTHVAKFNYSYELPFGKGRTYLSEGVLGRIVGGWRLAGVQTYSSGTPMSISPGYSLRITGAGNRVSVADYNGWRAAPKSGKFDPYADSWWDVSVMNKTPSLAVPSGASVWVAKQLFGNATRRNPKSRGPWVFNENISVARTFQLSEDIRVDLRWEAFNLLNRVRWGGPDSTLTSNNFGLVRSQANQPRQMQFGLKFSF